MLPNVARSEKKPKMGGYVYTEIDKVWYYLRRIRLADKTVLGFLKKKINGQPNKKIIYTFHMFDSRCLRTIAKRTGCGLVKFLNS